MMSSNKPSSVSKTIENLEMTHICIDVVATGINIFQEMGAETGKCDVIK